MKTELANLKAALEAKREELARMLRRRDGITIEKSADDLEAMQQAAERELAVINLHREFSLLRNVRAALQRLDEGTYGICVLCEEEITPKRLKAVPWAPLCIRCQAVADRGEERATEAMRAFLETAA